MNRDTAMQSGATYLAGNLSFNACDDKKATLDFINGRKWLSALENEFFSMRRTTANVLKNFNNIFRMTRCKMHMPALVLTPQDKRYLSQMMGIETSNDSTLSLRCSRIKSVGSSSLFFLSSTYERKNLCC